MAINEKAARALIDELQLLVDEPIGMRDLEERGRGMLNKHLDTVPDNVTVKQVRNKIHTLRYEVKGRTKAQYRVLFKDTMLLILRNRGKVT